ncbi:protein translocase subunit SecD [Candidatus Methylopumilus planktonicus]|uniref:protein translocase subunit SecD n=1 Tax=Candidatus Methylopumilus planktonicus TaxID=1581557 RepID=UPI001122D4E2|nr:protein translocase subunit SecD [Candidatus Methylopumilus planktonicus]QDD00682.1 protein translocase subunit SecD [Candidatus Methylopumilus planktonicus]
MNQYPKWKYGLVLVAIFIGLIYSIPNFFGESPAVQIMPTKSSDKLDLSILASIEGSLKEANLPFDGIVQEPNGIKIKFANPDNQLKAKDILQNALGANYVIALNLVSKSPSWLSKIGAIPMYLGLDLRGGVHFLLQVDMKAASEQAAESNLNDFRMTLRKERISYIGASRLNEIVKLQFDSQEDLEKAKKLIKVNYPDLMVNESSVGKDKALDISMSEMGKKKIQEFALKQNLQTLHNRINELGVAEPIIQQQGLDRIVVQLPGVQDTAKAKEILGRTATLEIRLVDEDKTDIASLESAQKGNAPYGDDLFKDRDGRPILVKKNVLLTGERITDAGPGVDQQSGRSVVHVTLDGRGSNIFKQVTRENVGKRLAILLVEKGQTEVVTAPVIQQEIGGGRVQISGMNSPQEATDISLLLRAGALAAPMQIIEERTVGPSMGEENIKRGVHSTLWGFAAISIMMIIYYMAFGGVSIFALAVNLLLLVALLSIIQATLTLPGLAAIALALGMAIDANVLINERIREELRNGNTPQASIHAGYDRAFDTILDSNVTTLIAGLALFMFGTGPIKGFAVVHVLGILTSMFSAILVSRALVNIMYGYRRKIDKLSIGQIYRPKED